MAINPTGWTQFAAGIAAVVAFFVTKTTFPPLGGKLTYVVVGILTLSFALVIRFGAATLRDLTRRSS